MPITLDMYTLVALITCAVVILAFISITGTQFTFRTVIIWVVASLILAPFARKLIVSIARRMHM
jgi:hypothetical protein